jgi:hypothetical protein
VGGLRGCIGMKLERLRVPALAALALALLLVAGCGPQGEDGTSYLALDWTYAPLTIDFPQLPGTVVPGTYYWHPEGLYHGEYVAWEGSWWVFTYRIEVNEGDWGIAGLPGADGADRFYTMYLYSWGPELSYVELSQSLSLVQPNPSGENPAAREQARAAALSLQPSSTRRASSGTVDASRFDLEHPEPYRFERTGPGYRLLIEGRRYSPLK